MLYSSVIMAKQEIKRSRQYFDFKVAFVTVAVLVLIVASFFILRGARTVLGIEITTFGWLVRLALVGVAGIALFVAKQQYSSKQYFITDNQISIVSSGFGSMSTQGSKIITIEPKKVSSVTLNQTALEKRYNAGTVVIELDTRSGKDIIKLEYIENPNSVMQKIENYLQS